MNLASPSFQRTFWCNPRKFHRNIFNFRMHIEQSLSAVSPLNIQGTVFSSSHVILEPIHWHEFLGISLKKVELMAQSI